MARVLIWDIESTNLHANFGTILCIGYKWLGQKSVHVTSIKDSHKVCKPCGRIESPEDDKEVLREFSKIYAEADIGVTWYGRGFDVPFVQTRLLHHGLPPLAPTPHVDGCRDIAQRVLKLHSNRLASVQEFLQLEDRKTPLASREWNLARAGKPKGLNYVIDHCKADVKVLEQAYLRLRGLMARHPNVSLLMGERNGCPCCGGHNIQARGLYVSGSRKYQRFQCQTCGSWFKEPQAVKASRRLALAAG